jgi:hypothetical protein
MTRKRRASVAARTAKPKRARGRPCLYTGEIADKILGRVACGESLRQICRDDDMPHEATVRNWVVYDREGLATRYARARELRADVWADEIVDLARDVRADAAHVAKAKLEIDAIKWTASKLMPRRYGEHLTTALTGANGGPIKTEQQFPELKDPDATRCRGGGRRGGAND